MSDKHKSQYGRDGKPLSKSVRVQEGYNGKLPVAQARIVQPPKILPPPPPPKKG